MDTNREKEIGLRTEKVNAFVLSYVKAMDLPPGEPIEELRRSMIYSATNGGKRFRPVISMLVAELFSCPVEKVLPFALAVEMIHTYSLIHDDLPCMDNDDFRRGQPTNHKVYGEDFALLAGDSLLTEAFFLLSSSYAETPTAAVTLVRLLSEAAGIRGMVGGQAIDLRAGDRLFTAEDLTHLHLLKTGALIRVAAEGAAVIAGATPEQRLHIREFGQLLGLAFQVADDILDHGEKDQDVRSFTGILGVEKTKELLAQISRNSLSELKKLPPSDLLSYLVDFNLQRQH